ncbi:hypothetical protein EC968_007919 [Mortierella alpina]|nr:hypothetical protein EC968_007919 [Mortierella alpina]
MQSPARRPTGQVYNKFARNTTIATIDELNVLREAIRSQAIANKSSSQYLMDQRYDEQCLIHDPRPGQPRNLLPSYLLRGMIVTDGRSLNLSAVDLRIRSRKRFMTELVSNPSDGHIYRQHIMAPDPHRYLPNISSAIPDVAARASFFPDTSKVDIGALDLGKEYMAAFSCTRYDRPDFSYSVQAKTKAVYQPTVKAAKELETRLDSTTISHRSEGTDHVEAITVYQSGLTSLGTDPSQRVVQEKQDGYRQVSAFYNKHGEHQKRQAHSKRGRRGDFDVLTNHILTAMGTHEARSEDPDRRGLILVGLGQFSPTSKGYQASVHGSFLRHFVPRARSLGYIVLEIDEFYTSRRCPTCKCPGSEPMDFVGYVAFAARTVPGVARGIIEIVWLRPIWYKPGDTTCCICHGLCIYYQFQQTGSGSSTHAEVDPLQSQITGTSTASLSSDVEMQGANDEKL